jgi:hypothetical protein
VSPLQLVWEATNADRTYRATVNRRSIDNLLQVELWKWRVTEVPGRESHHYWSPLGTLSIVDTEEAARRVAKARLEDISGQPLNLTPDAPTIEWIRERSGDSSAQFLDPASLEVRSTNGPLQPSQVVHLSELYLVEEIARPHEWWMGSEVAPGVIVCWGVYGDLASAIDSR